MARIASTWWFLGWTVVLCGVAVALASWVTDDESNGDRALAILIGLVAGVFFMLLVAWALAAEKEHPAAAAPPAPVPAPTSAPVAGAAPTVDVREVLTGRLEEGRTLRGEVEPGAPDPRVGAWIAETRQVMERHKPGLAGYYGSIGSRTYADDADRLDAHLARLATVVRDML